MNLEWFSILRLRLRALMARRRLDRDLEAEMAFHLATRAEQSGMEEARRRFGNPTALKEACREMWTFYWMEMLWQDLRYAVRTLRKSPGFTVVAALTLALGIGANTAIFSVVNAVILRPLPYPEPARLVELFGNVKRAKVERRGTSFADYLDWRAQSKSFEDMALYIGNNFTLTGLDEPERIPGEFVGTGLLPAARDNAGVGTDVPSGRRSGAAARRGGGSERRPVEAALRRRPRRSGPHDPVGWPRIHRHRRHAAVVPRRR